MCGVFPEGQSYRNQYDRPTEAAERLSKLMWDHAGVDFPPERLKRFLLENWTRVSRLAHTVHGS